LQICSAKPCDPVPEKILDDMIELVNPKESLWSGEDNTSPQIKKVTGKNVDDNRVLFYRGYSHCAGLWLTHLFLT
jgi:hypothetical protein